MKQAKLEDLFDYLPKSKIKAGDGLEEGKYPFYTSSENQSKYLNNFQHGPGCLVFGTGGKASVHLTTSHFATSTDCITIKPKPNVGIDAGYVFHYFKGNMQVLENGFKGAGLKHISKGYLSDIQIPHPEEITDQIRIAHLLGKVEGLIAPRKQHLQQLDDLLKSVFLETFGDPVRNEKGWETSTIDGLCEAVIDCPHSTPEYSESETGYYCIRSSDIVEGYLDLSKTYQVDQQVFEDRIARYRPQANDIVYSREGGRLGNAARIISSEPICLGQRMMLFKASAENSPEFLWALLESVQFKSRLQGLIGGGAAPRVNIKDLKKLVVIKPNHGVQLSFSKLVLKVDELRGRYRHHLIQLETLYGALSQQTFRGELDLSRVPLQGIKPEEAIAVAPEPLHVPAEHGLAIDLPDTNNLLDAPVNPEAREVLIIQWLEAYRGQLGSTPFSVQQFMAAAQTRLAELHPDNDFALGANDYEHIKAWVFEALAAGTLTQAFDDAGNRIELKAVQA